MKTADLKKGVLYAIGNANSSWHEANTGFFLGSQYNRNAKKDRLGARHLLRMIWEGGGWYFKDLPTRPTPEHVREGEQYTEEDYLAGKPAPVGWRVWVEIPAKFIGEWEVYKVGYDEDQKVRQELADRRAAERAAVRDKHEAVSLQLVGYFPESELRVIAQSDYKFEFTNDQMQSLITQLKSNARG